jgi:RNA polymerase sigma-70 factor (family 1)
LPELAEDLVHEVFMKVWTLRETLAIRSSLSAYLYRASRNHAINMLERIAADRELRQAVIRRLEAVLEEDLSEAARLQRYEELLNQSLEAMPPQRRRVYELCRRQGLSYDEAAAELGLSRNTVKDHMAKALRFLRKDLLDRRDLVLLILLLEKLF